MNLEQELPATRGGTTPAPATGGLLARVRLAFRGPTLHELQSQLRTDAEILAESHRASAEHHQALAQMYEDRANRLTRGRRSELLPDPFAHPNDKPLRAVKGAAK